MPAENFTEAMQAAFQDVWITLINFLPNLLAALLVIIIGWIIGALLGKAVVHLLKMMRVDEALKKSGVESSFEKANVRADIPRLLGAFVKWTVILIALIFAFDVMGLEQVNLFINDLVRYLPQVFVAILVLLIASVVADVAQKAIIAAGTALNTRTAHFLGKFARVTIWIFGIMVALHQLGIAPELIQILFTGMVLAMALALGLSFGLGGRQAASDVIDRVRREVTGRRQ
jgi:small-conductance mechanosensitive channel